MTDFLSGVCETTHPYVPRETDPVQTDTDRALERTTGIIGRTPAIRLLRQQVVRYAKTTATVVIHGETGTGKELVAHALHALSPRARQPFVAANVAALTDGVLQSELFGHERGAFTGAHLRHKGIFEQAQGGTAFLDEIGELSLDAQAALLRVLETREVRPVGAEHPRRIDVRIVVATHRPLGDLVRHGSFREDLFYRLHALVLRSPPLRHRVHDLPLLARHVLAGLAPEVGERVLDDAALRLLADYGWPGNVRQFQNVLRRATVETDSRVIKREHIHAALADEIGTDGETKDTATVAAIATTLAQEHWNLTQTAKRLGMPRSTLRYRIRRAGLVPDG